MKTVIGLDIGGANIKAADAMGHTVCRPFAIWRHPEKLQAEVTSILEAFPRADRLALTMTAELADCFSTKAEGVRFILDAVEASAKFVSSDADASSEKSRTSNVVVWTTDGQFVSPDRARNCILKVAAANWHALATWIGRFAPSGGAVLIDIGTTTSDIIPLLNGRPIPTELTDVGRLQSGELSYSGVKRTPLCAVAHCVPFRQGYCSLAAEVFATTLDLYLLSGEIAEQSDSCETANGKTATKAAAHDRIARMLCGDRDEVSFDEAIQIARFLADVQRQRLAGSLDRVVHRIPETCQTVIVSGSGSFLARQLIAVNRRTSQANVVSLADKLSPEIAEAACAYAVAMLSQEGD